MSKKKKKHVAAKGGFRRFGMVDMLLLYWQPIDARITEEDPETWKRFEQAPGNWFVRNGCYLRCRKIRKGTYVWLAQKQQEKQ